MKTYSGKGDSLDRAIEQAAQAAVADSGPDALVNFSVSQVRGTHGGIAAIHEVEVDVTVRSDETNPSCGEALEYHAYQREGTVTVIAYGQHQTAGFEIALEVSPIDVFPPQFILTHRPPAALAAQVITPFVAFASFRATDAITTATVEDARGTHEVSVKQLG